jgi:hypothetical protein
MTRLTHTGLRMAGTFAAVAALSLIGGIASAQEAWTPQFVDGKLQPLPDGFPNQAISLVVLDEAGS